jgi:MFS family permease
VLVAVLMCITGISAAGYGVMFTVLDSYRDDYGISESALGWVVAVGFFASFIVQIGLASLADRGHARRLLILGSVVGIAGMLVMAYGTTVLQLAGGRAVMGVGAGLITPAARRLVIVSDPTNLGRNVGLILVADVAGFALGPGVSAVLEGPYGIAAPFLTIAALTAVLTVPLLAVHIPEAAVSDAPRSRFSLGLLRHRALAGAVCFGCAVFVMIGFFDAMWSLVLDDLDAPGWMEELGIIMFAMPLLFLGAIGGRMAQRLGPFRVGTIGLVVGALAMFSYGQWGSATAMFVVAMIHGINDGATVSSSGVAVGMVAPQERMAEAQGVLGGMQTLSGGLAAVLAGELYEAHGRGVAYAACAAVMLVLITTGSLLAGRHWSMRPGTEVAPLETVPTAAAQLS